MKVNIVLLGILGAGMLFAQAMPKYYYRFDSEAIEDSIGSCNGKAARLVQSDGLYGKALYFPPVAENSRNLSPSISIPLPPDVFTKPFTYTLWVKLDANSTYRLFKDFLSLGGERGPGMRLTYFYNSLTLRSGDGKQAVSMGTNSSTVLLPLQRWFQVAVVYDGELASIYIDGVLKASKKIQLSLGSGQLSVGTYRFGYAYPAQGSIDELKIYDTPFTHSQVVDAYLSELK